MKQIENFGILAALSWSQNKWACHPTQTDREKSNFSFVKEHGTLFESITFGHKLYPCEKNQTYIGYTPTFQDRRPTEQNSKHVKILFFRSLDPERKQMFIVGFYAFPEFGQFIRLAKHEIYKFYDWGNIKGHIENIVCLDNPVPIDNDIATQKCFIPPFKKISQRGFNYLESRNVINILDETIKRNTKQKEILEIKEKLTKLL